ncbi:MAG TPA: hypothetical protein VIH83_04720 [Candidatus Bathyarchaeia archaeon]
MVESLLEARLRGVSLLDWQKPPRLRRAISAPGREPRAIFSYQCLTSRSSRRNAYLERGRTADAGKFPVTTEYRVV